MANVIHPHIDFHHGTVTPNLCFGFGMSNSPAKGWQQPIGPGHNNSAVFQQLASNIAQPSFSNRPQKRRHEPDDYENVSANGRHGLSHATATGLKDEAMERSPTPERPKKGPPKRARLIAVTEQGNKEQRKENKPSGGEDDGDVDVGVLLASLPPQSLLPLLTSLLNAQPSLKSTIISLIPRPTLQTAVEVLAQSAKKLRDAYPYSNVPTPFPSPSPSPVSSTPGFGSGFGSTRPPTSVFGNSALGFGQPSQPIFGHNPSGPTSNNGGMRHSYILSRLRPHIDEFVSTCTSYLPYFSYVPETASSSPSTNSIPPRQRPHPSDVYVLLSALTSHICSQPPLTQSSLIPLILPRLHKEWIAWVDRVDAFANNEGGMFGGETVKGWARDLDEFADAKVSGEGWESMREVRDKWVSKVGWLVGRRLISRMDDMEEEL